MDLAGICEVLQATQLPDEAVRKAAEQKLDDAKTNALDQLVQALVGVLAAGDNVAAPLRLEAAVLLRRYVQDDWDSLQMETCKALKAQILVTIENDQTVRRTAGFVVAAIAQEACEDLQKLMEFWPELLPWLATASIGCNAPARCIALAVLRELVPAIGEEMLGKGDQVKDMLAKALSDPAPEIRAAGAQLILGFIQHLDSEAHEKLAEAMPALTNVLQGLASGSTEKELEETLGTLVAAVEEESEFFFNNNFEALWGTLMTICNADGATFGTAEIRHLAMECIMSMAEGCNDEEGFKLCLEGIIEVNFNWMLEVEKDVAAWTTEGKDTGEDGEIDDDVVRIGEENFDRLGTSYDEDEIMPILFKVLTAKTQNGPVMPEWTHVRSAIMAIFQVVEHLDDDSWVDQSIDFIMRHFEHPHPRVRYCAFAAISQCAFDQQEHLQDKYAVDLIPKMLKGMQDENIRVVTSAVESFHALVDDEDVDAEDMGLDGHMEELLLLLFKHLDNGESKHLQEQCIASIAVAAQSSKEQFTQYYDTVMPLLKQIICAATKDEQRNLRGKAFLCIATIGEAVGKELFGKDACEVMNAMTPFFQAGFAADDQSREPAHEACAKIAQVIGKDFKGYVSVLLPTVFTILKAEPKDIMAILDEEDDLDNVILNDLGGLGLKTSVLEEIDDSLELLIILVEALEVEFCDFIGPTCQVLLPMLDYPYPLSEDVRETVYRAWGHLAKLARLGVENGRLQPAILSELVTEFLKKTVGSMGEGNPQDVCENNAATCAKIQTLAAGANDVIQKAGPSVLTREAMADIARVVGQLLNQIVCDGDASALPKRSKKRDPDAIDDDEEDDRDFDEDEDSTPTPQTVRFALADLMCSLMRTNTEEFVQDVLPTMIGQLVPKLLQESSNSADRSLGFHIADTVTDFMGERSVQYWQVFMNQALLAILDKSPVVQQYAAKVIGTGARQKQYSIMALAACQNVYKVLQKYGEKYKRRRAKGDQKPTALALEACVRALGLICEHQEQQLGQHAPQLWSMWIASLPIKYDVEASHQVHEQLLRLLTREHPALVEQTKLPIVLRVLTDVYKTKRSTNDLDKNIAFAIAQIGQEKLEVLCSDFKEGQKKKTEQMLRFVKAAGGA